MISEDRSVALPFDRRPPALDGSLPGDVGFDPAGFTNKLPQVRFLFSHFTLMYYTNGLFYLQNLLEMVIWWWRIIN